jgi:hypothetical protein
LVESAGEPFSNLALAGQLKLLRELLSVGPRSIPVGLKLLPGDEDAGQRGKADQPLHEGRTDAVDGIGALLIPQARALGVAGDKSNR